MEIIHAGSVYAGNFGEAAAWAREMTKRKEWTPEEALAFTEEAYRRTMLEQLSGVPQAERPEELPEDSLLFQA